MILLQAEDKQFTMKPERRKIALQHYLLQLRQSIEREQKGREGTYCKFGNFRENFIFGNSIKSQNCDVTNL